MPVYDFECKRCGTVKEVFVHLDELDKEIVCDNKCEPRMSQLVSATKSRPRGNLSPIYHPKRKYS